MLEILDNRLYQKINGARRSLFESLGRPALLPLPECRYEFAQWKKARVNIDYHSMRSATTTASRHPGTPGCGCADHPPRGRSASRREADRGARAEPSSGRLHQRGDPPA